MNGGIMFPVFIMLVALCATGLNAQSDESWRYNVALVKTKLDRLPGTAFVVAAKEPYVYLVTSAHVTEGDQSPRLSFDAGKSFYSGTVVALEGQERHGLALIRILHSELSEDMGPPGVRAQGYNYDYHWTNRREGIKEGRTRHWVGDAVMIAGFKAPEMEISTWKTKVLRRSGRDLELEGKIPVGYSGAPVLANGEVVGLAWGFRDKVGLAVSASSVRAFLEGSELDWPSAPSARQPYAPERPELESLIGLWVRIGGSSEWPEKIRVMHTLPKGIDAAQCDCTKGEGWKEVGGGLYWEFETNQTVSTASIRVLPDGRLEYSFLKLSAFAPQEKGTNLYRRVTEKENTK
jgi:hypothetical protein